MGNLPSRSYQPTFNQRELEILQLIKEGLSNHAIAQRLFLSLGTVKWYNRQIFSKLEVASRTQAIEKSIKIGLLEAWDVPPITGITLQSGARPRQNLPVSLTSFIGREKEIETLKQLVLSGQTRLVTVTGAGGTGKTRLALRVAQELTGAFPHGIWLVELAALMDPDLVPAAVASALNLSMVPDRPVIQVVVDFLHPKRALILLDTCEHLVGAVASLADLVLHTAPQVSILTTSREILGIHGEMPFRCPSLALPAPHLLAHPDGERMAELISCEAIRLFAERAALASPGFVVSPDNALIVAQVCCRLDGIPLAIELAAARTRMLSVEQIAGRLDQAFLLLTGGSRTALPRQQTLKATIDWSYNLLSPAERALLLRLSIFSGGWTLEAAESVCSSEGDNPASLRPAEILDLLSRLVDKSLVLVAPGQQGERRYRMLDTVHQYARQRLLETGGDKAVRRRHLDYFLHLAEQAEPYLRARGMVEWLGRLEMDLANLRLALEWSLTGLVEQGLRLGAALLWFWHMRHRQFEGIQWLERLLEADQAGETIPLRPPVQRLARGKALMAAGLLNHYYPGSFAEHAQVQLAQARLIIEELGDLGLKYLPAAMFLTADSEEDYRNCLAVARRVGDDLFTAELMVTLRFFSLDRGDLAQAMVYARESLAIRQKVGDVDGEAFAFDVLAELEFLQGNHSRAIELWEKCQQGYQSTENQEWALYFSSVPAWVALAQGDCRKAFALSEAQLAAGVEINSTIVIAEALGNLCWAAWALKEYDQVVRRCEETAGPDWENNLPCGRGTLFYVIGRVALSQGDYPRAADYLGRLDSIIAPLKFMAIQALGILATAQCNWLRAAIIFGALYRLSTCLNNISSPAERREYEQALEATCLALGSQEFSSAWAEGEAMSWPQALDFVLEGLELP